MLYMSSPNNWKLQNFYESSLRRDVTKVISSILILFVKRCIVVDIDKSILFV